MTDQRDDRKDFREGERLLPHSLDAERAVLGAIMINPELFAVLPGGFTELAFYRDAHRRIFRAARKLYERQSTIDLLTITEELKRTGETEAVGGPAYLASLVDGVPRAMNAPHYANIVTEHATRRAVIRLAHRMMDDAYAGVTQAEDLLATAQQGVVEIAAQGTADSASSVRQLLPITQAALEQAATRQDSVIGVPTGFSELDLMTAGFQPADYGILASRPSIGKTALACNIAEHTASLGLTVIFSLEMTKDALMRRMIAAKARVEGHRLRTGRLSEADYQRVGQAMCELEGLALVIDDAANLHVEDLSRRLHRVTLEHGAVTMVIIDYLQLLSTRSKHENRTQQVSFISKTLKALAKELNVPVLALSQLSRGIEMGKKTRRPVLSDLRESGSLEQDADLVLFLHRTDDEAELIVAKQRNGPVGTVTLTFHEAYTRFENYQPPEDDREDYRGR